MKLRIVRQFNLIIANVPWLRKIRVKHPISFWILMSSILFSLFAFLIYMFERGQEEPLGPLDAIRAVFVLFLGEWGQDVTSPVAKFVAILALIVGVAIFSAILSNLASYLIGKKMEVKMPDESKKLIIICNWNDRGDRVIKELHAATDTTDAEIVVISEQEIMESELRTSPAYDRVLFFRNDPTSYDVMKKLGVRRAESVIILADDTCSDPDAKTALISLAITSHAEEGNQAQKPYIVAEVMDSRKEQHLKCAGVDEWVCASFYRLGILAQCTFHHRLSDVYHQLLTYSPETNEIYLVEPEKYPGHFLDNDFPKLSRIINKNRKEDNPAVLLGVKIGKTRKIEMKEAKQGKKEKEVKENTIVLNPREGEFDKLTEGDSLVVMAFGQPDLSNIPENENTDL